MPDRVAGSARGLSCDAEQIVIVNGSQQGIDLAARVLLDPGDGAIVEEPHYPGATLAFEAIGAQIIRIPTDAQGLDTARLPPSSERARLAYVTPCHQFPTGVIMPLERRLALLDWASRTDAWIVEDDYNRYYSRPPGRAGLIFGYASLTEADIRAGIRRLEGIV